MNSVETLFDSLKTYIEDNLPQFIDEQRRVNDVYIELPDIQHIYRADIPYTSASVTPCIIISYGSVDLNSDGRTIGYDEINTSIDFYVVSKGQDAELVQRQIERYLWSLKTLFHTHAYNSTQYSISKPPLLSEAHIEVTQLQIGSYLDDGAIIGSITVSFSILIH